MRRRGRLRAATRPAPQRRSIPFKSTASSRTAYRSRRLFYASQLKVISHSFRRSFFQKQSRTAAPCLVDNFGIPLCWALFLFFSSPLTSRSFFDLPSRADCAMMEKKTEGTCGRWTRQYKDRGLPSSAAPRLPRCCSRLSCFRPAAKTRKRRSAWGRR